MVNGLMSFGLMLALAQTTVQPQEQPASRKPGSETLDEALECRVYVDLAKSVHANRPDMLEMESKLQRYWLKRGDELGRKQGLTPEALSIRQLVFPLKAERFKDVLIGCLDMTPKKALR